MKNFIQKLKESTKIFFEDFKKEDGFLVSFPTMQMAALTPGTVIKSIESVVISMSSAQNSLTYTLANTVNTAKTMIIYNGVKTNSTSTTDFQCEGVRVALTSSTVVTATRSTNSGKTAEVRCSVIEFITGVNAIRSGTISLTTTSATDTFTAVGANAFVLYLGAECSLGSANYSDSLGVSVELTNTTTVTARTGISAGTYTVGYMVVDLTSAIVTAVQQRSIALTSNGTSTTDTITSSTTTNTIIVYNGFTCNQSRDYNSTAPTIELTNATTVTIKRLSGDNSHTWTVRYTVITLATSCLNSNIQRGTLDLGTVSVPTVFLTITTVVLAKSCVNFGGWKAGSGTPDRELATLRLDSATQVAAQVGGNSGGDPSATLVRWEVIEFK